ncbi:hypothetical protein L208DRAFT_1250896 [Tricholoma matsutake]|nr:hypothetical protein L208DRAFT_1250896 [Tricholoma matsutake 945]
MTNVKENSQGGVFCAVHQEEFAMKCHVQVCTNTKVTGTKACRSYQDLWKKHIQQHRCQTLPGAP